MFTLIINLLLCYLLFIKGIEMIELKILVGWSIIVIFTFILFFLLKRGDIGKGYTFFFIFLFVYTFGISLNKDVLSMFFPMSILIIITSFAISILSNEYFFKKVYGVKNSLFCTQNLLLFGVLLFVSIEDFLYLNVKNMDKGSMGRISFIWAASLLLAWLCARAIIYFMGCGRDKIWTGNLLSALILQVAGYIFFRESAYYWLGAYCLILGQLLSLSIDLYLREKRRGKDSAHC